MVCGIPMIPSDGFTMGSGLGPGGSSLLASWKEGKLWHAACTDVHIFIILRCIIARWMDDLYILKPSFLPPAVADFFRALTELNFYGEKLLLERDFSVQPFGFLAIISELGLQLTQNLKYKSSFAKSDYQQLWPNLQCAISFQSASRKRGLLYGLGVRLLDMAASGPEVLTASLERYQLELLSLGFLPDLINRVSDKVTKLASRELLLPRFGSSQTWGSSHFIRQISLDVEVHLNSVNQLLGDKLVPF